MNLRNRKLVITIRTIFGLLMMLSGIAGLLTGKNTKGVPTELIPAMQILWQTGLLQMIKATEAIAGAMLLFGIYPALATIFIAPIAIGIIVFNARMTPMFVPIGIIIAAFTAYMGYAYWDKYRAMFKK